MDQLQQLLQQIEAKKKRLDSYRPLPPAVIKNLDDWYRVELTYTSNAIEGNTLSRRETQLVVSEGSTVEGKTIVEHLEAKNHAEAFDFIKNYSTKEITINTILDIHKIILKGIDDANAGRFRTVGVRIAGSEVIMPNAAKIPQLMEEFNTWLQNSSGKNPVISASEAHFKLVSIHPFIDGNGRTARLLMNLILDKNDYPRAVINKEDRRSYLDAVEKGQLTGDLTDYHKLVYLAVNKSLDVYLEMIEGKKEEEFLTVIQAAKLLQVHPESVRRWVRAGKVPAIKLGGKYLRIKKTDLNNFISP